MAVPMPPYEPSPVHVIVSRDSGRVRGQVRGSAPPFDQTTEAVVEASDFVNPATMRWRAETRAWVDLTPTELADDANARADAQIDRTLDVGAVVLRATLEHLPGIVRQLQAGGTVDPEEWTQTVSRTAKGMLRDRRRGGA